MALVFGIGECFNELLISRRASDVFGRAAAYSPYKMGIEDAFFSID